jgi:hypothetical protein
VVCRLSASSYLRFKEVMEAEWLIATWTILSV